MTGYCSKCDEQVCECVDGKPNLRTLLEGMREEMARHLLQSDTIGNGYYHSFPSDYEEIATSAIQVIVARLKL